MKGRALLLSALMCTTAAADDAATRLDKVSVTATKTPREVRETAGVITVIDAEEIENRSVQDIRDLVRYEPGVSVTSDPARFGLNGFSIRGIGANRVLVELDGVPVSDTFSIGAFSNAGRDFVDPEVLKRVEILRGAASSLYGSDAIAGVVSFTTRDPADYLAGDNSYFAGKAGYNSDDDSWVTTLLSAFGNERNAGLVTYTRREGGELDNMGDIASLDDSRTAPNPQDYVSDNVLLKGVFDRGDNVFRITLDAHRGETETEVFSSRSVSDQSAVYGFPYIVSTTDLDGIDERERTRLVLGWDFAGARWFDGGSLSLYGQRSETAQDTIEARTNNIAGVESDVLRNRHFLFEQDLVGVNLDLRRAFEAGSTKHQLVYGLEVEQTDTEQLRDGTETNLQTGVTSPTILPDQFPVRDFPPSKTLEAGLYLQDEIRWQNGFMLIAGLRVDHYRLDVNKADAIFVEDNPTTTPQDISETSISPKLGFLQPFGESWALFGQYAHGFRSPPYNDVNVGFTNLMFGYTAIPNAALEPETSDSLELGVRYSGAATSLEFTLFQNRHEDFIETLVNLGRDPESGLIVYQSQNVDEVTIEGAELRFEHHFDTLPGLRAIAALLWSEGENDQTGEDIVSVDPHRLVAGLDYTAPSQKWGVEFVSTFVDGRETDDEAQFATPGYALFDLMGWVNLADNVKLVGGMFNLTDRKHWEWASVQGIAANDPAIDRYTRPGINGSVALRVSF